MNSIYNRTDEEFSVIGEVQANFIANDPLYQQGFKAGADSRDAEVQRLQMALADTEALELGTAGSTGRSGEARSGTTAE